MKIDQDHLSVYLLASLLAFLTLGCDSFPKDPDKTLEKINNGQMIVGYTENRPWVIKTSREPAGHEADLIRKFALAHQATIVWQNDTEQDLFEKLEKKKLHLAIGGFTDKNAWKSKISFTRPFVEHQKNKHVMAVLKGENAFIIALETFLRQQEPYIKTQLRP